MEKEVCHFLTPWFELLQSFIYPFLGLLDKISAEDHECVAYCIANMHGRPSLLIESTDSMTMV